MGSRTMIVAGMLSILLLILLGCAQPDGQDNVLDDPQQECERVGGEWRTFSDACADTCSHATGQTQVCAQVLTDSCDCGEGRCWNGRTCTALQE